MDWIGVYTLSNTGAIFMHDIDYVEDKVLASLNGKDKQWCDLIERQVDDEFVTGFEYGEIFVPLNEVMRVMDA